MHVRTGVGRRHLLGALVLVCMVGSACSRPPHGDMNFDSKVWKDDNYNRGRDAAEDCPRQDMAEDLLQRIGLVGRTKGEVEELLGRWDWGPDNWCLGLGNGFMDSESIELLELKYDESGRVVRARTNVP